MNTAASCFSDVENNPSTSSCTLYTHCQLRARIKEKLETIRIFTYANVLRARKASIIAEIIIEQWSR